MKAQRKEALDEAYGELDRGLLKMAENYVTDDCQLFGYHCDVDTRFPVTSQSKVTVYDIDHV